MEKSPNLLPLVGSMRFPGCDVWAINRRTSAPKRPS